MSLNISKMPRPQGEPPKGVPPSTPPPQASVEAAAQRKANINRAAAKSAAASSSAQGAETAAPNITKRLISVERVGGTNGKGATFIAKEVSPMPGQQTTQNNGLASQSSVTQTEGGRRKRRTHKRTHKSHKRTHKSHKRSHKSHKRIHR